MSSLPNIKPVLEFLAPGISEGFENAPGLPPGTKGRSPSPIMTKTAEDLVNWAKASPENKAAYQEFRQAARKWDDHIDVIMGNTLDDEGLLEREGAELKKARYALETEIEKFVDQDLRARVTALQEELKPLLKEVKDQERKASTDPEVVRLTNLVEKMKSENTEGTALAATCELANSLVEAMRANKEPKLERGKPYSTVFKAYGLEDPTKNSAATEDDNSVEG